MAKISQPPKRSDAFSGIAWAVRRVDGAYQVLELHIEADTVVVVAPKGEPNLKEIAGPVIEGLVADHLVGGNVA